MKKQDHEVVQKGVTDSWDFWLLNNQIALSGMIDMAVENAVSRWLDAHSDEIIERITGPTSEELRALREQARERRKAMVTTPDLPASARTLLKQLHELVPAWSIDGPRHATGPCAFGGLSEQTDGEGKRKRTEIIEQVDSVLVRARHADGRAVVALWVRRPSRKGWTLDMAWRGRAAHEHAPQRLTATQLKAYVAAPDHTTALAATRPITESGIAA